jgi:hypothetical protein
MASLLTALGTSLAPRAGDAGFNRTDRASWEDLGWLGYRADDAAGIVLLDIFHVPAERRLTAELWRPARLAEALQGGASEPALEQRRSWQYAHRANRAEVGREVARAVAAWLTDSMHDDAAALGGAPPLRHSSDEWAREL